LRVGDQAIENEPLIGLVDAHHWRIYGNYKEAASAYVGTQAGLAFLSSMIQGQGQPISPNLGLDRFAGITAGQHAKLSAASALPGRPPASP
jgi:hypothetical protein